MDTATYYNNLIELKTHLAPLGMDETTKQIKSLAQADGHTVYITWTDAPAEVDGSIYSASKYIPYDALRRWLLAVDYNPQTMPTKQPKHITHDTPWVMPSAEDRVWGTVCPYCYDEELDVIEQCDYCRGTGWVD